MPEEKEAGPKKPRDDAPVELESQLVLRLPTTPAASLRAAVRSGVMNLKDRLTIQLEPDMRHGTVRFDKWALSAKVLDLPCIIESHKTLDRKTFYKTADICQMMVCREETDDSQKTDEEESPKKKEKKDTKDKKYMYPHGITPSLKNVKKRRFRKTLKKKYVDFPEIEKEVKRLFRMDNEAINVRYEIVNAEDDKGDCKVGVVDFIPGISSPACGLLNSNSQSLDEHVAEHDIFGEVLSSSEEDDVNIVDLGDDETSRLSNGTSQMEGQSSRQEPLVTEFSKGMLESPAVYGMSDQSQEQDYIADSENAAVTQLESATAEESLDQILKDEKSEQEKVALMDKLSELEQEIAGLQARRQAQEMEITSIENQALKQRFQSIIDNLKEQETDKQREYDDIVTLLHQT